MLRIPGRRIYSAENFIPVYATIRLAVAVYNSEYFRLWSEYRCNIWNPSSVPVKGANFSERKSG